MHIDKIKINNFKNYISSEVSFSNEINFLFGNNGAGKTNLLDAIYYLSYGKSAISSYDSDCINHNNNYFMIEGIYSNSNTYKCSFESSAVKKLYENGDRYKKIKDHIGKIPLVFITPYDINLIRNYGINRRRFFDLLFSQISREYLDKLIDYNRLIKQRNTYFKNLISINEIDKNQVKSYDEKLIYLNHFIHNFRRKEILIFNERFIEISKNLSDKKDKTSIHYHSNYNEKMSVEVFEKNLKKDFYSKKTSLGIHNDDYYFKLNSRLIKRYGSQGQQKLFIIGLKIAEFYILKENLKENPILMLDDIFHKLDDHKINMLINYLDNNDFSQIFISDSIYDRIEKIKKIKKNLKVFRLKKGIINEK